MNGLRWMHMLPEYLSVLGVLMISPSPQPAATRAQTVLNLAPHATIGLTEENLILGAFGLAALRGEHLVVADKLECSIKVFNAHWQLAYSTGRRGEGNGEFRGPGPVATTDTLIAVADFQSTRVQVFTHQLRHLCTFHTDRPVFALAFDGTGQLWIGQLPNARGETLFRVDIRGNILARIALRHASGDIFDSVFTLAITDNGELVVAYMTRNIVEVRDSAGRFVRDFSVPGMRAEAGRRKLSTGLFSASVSIPEENMFLGVTAGGDGMIYLLADAYTENPRQDIYVVNPHGRVMSRLKLQEASSGICCDGHERLFSIERARMLIHVYQLRRPS